LSPTAGVGIVTVPVKVGVAFGALVDTAEDTAACTNAVDAAAVVSLPNNGVGIVTIPVKVGVAIGAFVDTAAVTAVIT